MLPEHTSTNK